MLTQNESYISGYFHFNNRITLDEIISLAKEFAEDQKFKEIYIQGAGSTEFRICFIYDSEYTGGIPSGFVNDFGDDKTDYLRKKVGNALKGWSISSEHISIK